MSEQWKRGMTRRLDQLYGAAAAGDDIPPGWQIRAEGYAECGLELGLVDRKQLAAMIDDAHARAFGTTLADKSGYDVQLAIDDDGRVCLPVWMRRAPVKPSTV